MTEEEKILARSWYDPRYKIVDPSDDAWWVDNGLIPSICSGVAMPFFQVLSLWAFAK